MHAFVTRAHPLAPRPLPRAVHRALMSLVLGALPATALIVSPAWVQAAEQQWSFDIGSGSLESVLMQFSATVGVNVSFQSATGQHQPSPWPSRSLQREPRPEHVAAGHRLAGAASG